jgi:hypothetical protein
MLVGEDGGQANLQRISDLEIPSVRRIGGCGGQLGQHCTSCLAFPLSFEMPGHVLALGQCHPLYRTK